MQVYRDKGESDTLSVFALHWKWANTEGDAGYFLVAWVVCLAAPKRIFFLWADCLTDWNGSLNCWRRSTGRQTDRMRQGGRKMWPQHPDRGPAALLGVTHALMKSGQKDNIQAYRRVFNLQQSSDSFCQECNLCLTLQRSACCVERQHLAALQHHSWLFQGKVSVETRLLWKKY